MWRVVVLRSQCRPEVDRVNPRISSPCRQDIRPFRKSDINGNDAQEEKGKQETTRAVFIAFLLIEFVIGPRYRRPRSYSRRVTQPVRVRFVSFPVEIAAITYLFSPARAGQNRLAEGSAC